ncbi:MAG: tetratricopeptide repeat protein [Wenzhouxiangellaceae bacterium]|nr:tetratricopeptide repeat protein [Wenzhouxiangellaceae bacterium]
MAVELYDEHEQGERVRKWLRENGFSIAMGIALALAAIFGWRQWQDYQSGQALLANEYYAAIQRELDAGQLEIAASQYAEMRDAVDQHGYVALAGMLVAAGHVEADDIEAAASIYRTLLESGQWEALKPLIRFRLAGLEGSNGEHEQALARLEGDPPEGYAGLWLELRGDLLFDLGRLEQAAEAYALAVDQLRGEGGNFRPVETKLTAVRSAARIVETS